jgi:hypothetical protein
LFPGVHEEKIYVCLEECDMSGVRFDYIPRPRILWSEDISLSTVKTLPKSRARKNVMYRTDQQEKADTFIYIITPENLTLMKPVEIILKTTECILDSKNFVYIGILKNNNDLSEFKALLIEQQKEYSGIKVREFDMVDEEKILCWVKE